MGRMIFSKWMAVIMVTLLFCGCTALKSYGQQAPRPNVILILTDDIGWGDLGCYGNKDVETPHIDALARRGMQFGNAYLTTSSCSPSRSSIITGRYPHNTGAAELYDTLPAGQIMFPELLKQAGYYTVLSGKNDMGRQVKSAFNVFNRGKGAGGEGNWVPLLKKRPKDQPFFCWFSSHDAHRKWKIDSSVTLYHPDTIQVPPMLFDGPETRKDLAGYYNQISRVDQFVGRVVQELKAEGILDQTYIIFMSDNGRPFPRCKTYLYDSGIKTPFIVSGPDITAGSLYDGLISAVDIASTILSLAGIPVSPTMQGTDFSQILRPTMTPAKPGTKPETIPPAKPVVRNFVFAEHNWHVYNAHERMVRHGDWVYIRNSLPDKQNLCGESTRVFPAGAELWQAHDQGLTGPEQENVFQLPRPSEELYNVKTDPYQFHNLASTKAHKEKLQELSRALDSWIQATGDAKPRIPRADREDVYGHVLSDRWKIKTEEPGASKGAMHINATGPILTVSHK